MFTGYLQDGYGQGSIVMPGLDLSSLNAQELRNVLEAARSRNQTDLTEEVLSELQTRRSRPPGHFPWRTQDHDAAVEQPEAWWEDLRQEAEVPEEPARSKAPMILGITAAVLVSAGVGWWLSPRGQPRVEEAPVASIEAPRAMAAYAPQARPEPAVQDVSRQVETAAAPVSAPEPVSAAPQPTPVVKAAPVAPKVAPVVPKPPPARVQLAKVEPTVRTPKETKPAAPVPAKASTCKAEPTPADQTVCASRALTAQHRQMRDAYERAIAAGADPLLVDRDQAEFRIRRDGVSNRDTLAKLYDRRIRELNAAAARASAARPG